MACILLEDPAAVTLDETSCRLDLDNGIKALIDYARPPVTRLLREGLVAPVWIVIQSSTIVAALLPHFLPILASV